MKNNGSVTQIKYQYTKSWKKTVYLPILTYLYFPSFRRCIAYFLPDKLFLGIKDGQLGHSLNSSTPSPTDSKGFKYYVE